MLTCAQPLDSLEDLRDYVNNTLCQYENLEVGAYPLTERILIRRGEPCGLYFCLHGPRQVSYTAIWETQTNTILFYGPTGERFQRSQLATAPSLELMTA